MKSETAGPAPHLSIAPIALALLTLGACGDNIQDVDAATHSDAALNADGARPDRGSSGDSVGAGDLTRADGLFVADAGGISDVNAIDSLTALDSNFLFDAVVVDDAWVDDAWVDDARVDDAWVDDARVDDAGVDDARVDDAGVDDVEPMDQGPDSSQTHDTGGTEAGQRFCAMGLPEQLGELTAEQLHSALEDKDFLLINVADATGGQIPGTDTFIAHNDTDALVAYIGEDQSARVVLYCNSSNRSGIAGHALVALGYCNISHLLGGRNAWTAAGYSFE